MGTEIVPAEPLNAGPPVVIEQDGGLMSKWGERESRVTHCLDLNAPPHQELYLKALGTADARAKESVKRDLNVVAWLLHEVSLTSQETGEVNPALRLVFILDDGQTVSTTSEPLVRHWWNVLKVYGQGPWEPPLACRLKLVKGTGPGEYLQFEKCGRPTANTNHKPKR